MLSPLAAAYIFSNFSIISFTGLHFLCAEIPPPLNKTEKMSHAHTAPSRNEASYALNAPAGLKYRSN